MHFSFHNHKKMGVENFLSTSLGRKDEGPNVELAQKIASEADMSSVKELIALFDRKKIQNLQNDAIKVLYEIGSINPTLISEYTEIFVNLLEHPNNRLRWGGMTALASIVYINTKAVYDHLPKILDAAEAGTVITKDYAVRILAGFCKDKSYAEDAFPILLEMIMKSPENQLAMYAEECALICTEKAQKEALILALSERLPDIAKATKKARIEKLIRKLNK